MGGSTVAPRPHRFTALVLFASTLLLAATALAGALAPHLTGGDAARDAPSASGAQGTGEGVVATATVDARVTVAGQSVDAGRTASQGVAVPVDAPATGVQADAPDAPVTAPASVRLGVALGLLPADAGRAGPTTQSWVQGEGVAAPGSAPALSAWAVGAAAAAATAGAAAWNWPALKRWALRFAFVPLYARIAGSRVLANDVRDTIYRLVQADPGITTSEIAKRANVSWGTTVYHLEVLEQNAMLVGEKHGRYRRFFANGAARQAERKVVGILRNDTSARIAEAVASAPGVTGRELADAAGLSPQALHWHTQRLLRAGVVRKERDGRVVRYYCA